MVSLLASVSGRVLNVAHRVAAGHSKGGSAERIAEVLASGADAIEVDVQATRDQELVLFHDRFAAIDGKPTRIQDVNLRDLRRSAAEETDPPIERLDEVLRRLAPRDTLVLLDIKVRGIVDKVIAAAREAGVLHRILVASFDYAPLTRAKELAPHVPTIVTAGFSRIARHPRGLAWTVFALLAPVLAARSVRADAVLCPAYRVTRRLVTAAHRAGIAVLVWGMTDRSQVRGLLAHEVDGLVNDTPELVRRELEVAPSSRKSGAPRQARS